MSFAREGYPFILLAMVIAAVAYAFALGRRSWPLWLLAFALTVVALWVAWFFRDPERQGARGNDIIVAPADGRLIMITEVDEPSFVHGRALRLSIFMNIFNVHVNRYPVSGTVRYVHYNPGRFLNAASEKSSLENEQMSIGIELGSAGADAAAPQRILVRQIAGLVARRIVTYSREGERVEQGERLGIIRFGSRVDVFLPVGSKPLVALGESTVAGTTTLATLPGR
jgi:phosphatidylserine decarboxylase